MSDHTPGPWEVLFLNDRGRPLPPVVKRQRQGRFSLNGFNSEQDVADAHLIAAAPDMLRALEIIVMLGQNMPCESQEVEVAKAAISKARGNHE